MCSYDEKYYITDSLQFIVNDPNHTVDNVKMWFTYHRPQRLNTLESIYEIIWNNDYVDGKTETKSTEKLAHE